MNNKDFWIHVTSENIIYAHSHEGDQSERFQLESESALLAAELIEEGKTTSNLMKRFGAVLFKAIFPDKINGLFRASLASARSEKCGLRVRLTFENNDFSSLPWEYLYDPNHAYFFCLSSEIIISRYIHAEHPIKSLYTKLPLKILAVISSPSDMPPLDVAKEIGYMRKAFKDIPDLVDISILPTAILSKIRQDIRTNNYHILHFIGHGIYNPDDKKGSVIFVDETGLSKPIDEEILSSFFIGNQTLRLIVLNACETAKSDSHKAYLGIAPKLISRGALAVVAMQHYITDQSALIFAHDFYSSIATGLPVDISVQEARKALLQEVGPNKRDFGTPVLFMRAPDGYLLDVKSSRDSSYNISTQDTKKAMEKVITKSFYYPDLIEESKIDKLRMQRMYDFGYIFIRLDQIQETGAWGHSLLGCMRKVSDRDLGAGWDIMRTEGGLITTTTCLCGIASQWENRDLFSFQPFVRAVIDFFSIRQDESGGFGSLGQSRDKMHEYEIIKTQPRHTALAIMALLTVEENHYAIVRGLKYLLEAPSIEYKKDYSTAMAIAFTISAFEKCRHSSWFYENLTQSQQNKIFGEWNSKRVSFIQELARSDSEYFPFWKPYSGFERFSYESFLLICDVFIGDIPELLRHRLQQGLLSLFNEVKKYDGLPFGPHTKIPDVGMTAFLLNCMIRGREREQFSHPDLEKLIDNFSSKMYHFIVQNFDKFDESAIDNSSMGYTYSASMAKLIEINNYVVTKDDNLSYISKLEQIINDISINYKKKNLTFGKRFIEWFKPSCDISAIEWFLKAKLFNEK